MNLSKNNNNDDDDDDNNNIDNVEKNAELE